MTCKDCIFCGKCNYDIYFVNTNEGSFQYQVYDEIETECEKFKLKDFPRYVELPCKIGATVFGVINGKVWQGEVMAISVRKSQNVVSVEYTVGKGYYTYDDIGVNLFFTREKAEKALKEREENAEIH